ncbi:hypothetical protein COU59_00680 [Candidatus Pacearchaeota archaeon CG10_big_fil_rev_8_21_14_0_10_34_12]|nr:MAG: hypothetical protein COU59_00680 [Candidatus Pacearchaeota archaeon CG10_big_fil_rev_8_21_14_0_10_34_12]
MTWTEKYRPKKFSEIEGQNEAIRVIRQFIENFNLRSLTKTSKKALILHGPPGIGKTTLAQVIANETDSEIFELNASDLRNKENLGEILRPAMEQVSLINKTKIILVDEADGLSGTDRGGVPELISLITNSKYPVIITANDVWKKNLTPLRGKAELVRLKEIDYKTIKNVLIQILKKENLFVENDVLTEISLKVKGDLRAAINDLQKEALVKSRIPLDERNREKDIFNVLREIYKSKPSQEMLSLFDSLNMPLDEVMLWIEKNTPAEYHGKELERAMDLLSKADVFKGRIYKQQYWRFLVYENIFLSYGISSAKNPSRFSGGFTSYKKPDRILSIWLHNQRTIKKKSIAEKYARFVHIGKKRAENEFPMVVRFLRNPEIQKELKLSEDEVEYLKTQ